MKPAVSGLLIGALLFCGFRAGGQSAESRDQGETKPTPVTLTNDRPTGFFPLDAETLAHAPPILALTITKVVNPGEAGLGISVYLWYRAVAAPGGEREKILIGNFSLYPPDHRAGFLLRASEAFRKLQEAGGVSKVSEVRLLIEMKRIHEKTPWTPVELVVAPPEWREETK
jgi:hypothetical protein